MSSQVKSSRVKDQVKSKSSHLIAILPAESGLNIEKRQDISNCQIILLANLSNLFKKYDFVITDIQ